MSSDASNESQPAIDRDLVHRTTTVCSVVVVFAVLIGLLVVARNILPLIFGAVLIAVVLNRLAEKITAIFPDHVSRTWRLVIVIGGLLLITIALMYAFANSASEQILQLANRVDNSIESVLQAAKEQPLVDRYLGQQQSISSVMPSSAKSLGVARNFFATTFGVFTDCLILGILGIYFCVSPEKYRQGALRLLPTSWRERLSQLMTDSSATLWRWMLGRLLAMLIVGLLFGLGLLVIGIPMPIELGVFAGLVTFIPNMGGIAAVIPALLLASQQGTSAFVSVSLLYLAIQFVESYLITPIVQEHQVSLPPAMVILAQVLAGLIFGFWGIVFATPLVAVGLLWVQRLYVQQWLENND